MIVNKTDYIKFKLAKTYNEIKNDVIEINDESDINEFKKYKNIYSYQEIISNKEYYLDRFQSYSLYYEDINNDIIENFESITINEFYNFNDYNIFPYLAHHIGIYNDYKKIGEIELNLTSFNERKYRVGLMSDIHYNDSIINLGNEDYIDDGTEFHDDLINALSLYQNKEEVKFICASGDISTDSVRHLLNFKQNMNEYAPTTNLYSCLGNHDFRCTAFEIENTVDPSYADFGLNAEDKNRLQIWNSIITPNQSNYELHFEDESTEYGKTSYWFEVPIEGTNKSDIYIFLSVNYGYGNYTSVANKILTEESEGIDKLIEYVGFMPSKYNIQFYSNSTLIWFKSLLEQFSNKRVFVFTHQFFSHKAGNYNVYDDKYSYAGDGWRITENSAYCLCGIQFEFLNKLNNEYKNTIWFTGHSHYKWAWQNDDKYINITNTEFCYNAPDDADFNETNRYLIKSPITTRTEKTGYNVHIPSTCRPLPTNIYGYTVAAGDSEGAIMDIYEDYVDIRGIIFKENYEEYKNKYYPLAQYRINIPAA